DREHAHRRSPHPARRSGQDPHGRARGRRRPPARGRGGGHLHHPAERPGHRRPLHAHRHARPAGRGPAPAPPRLRGVVHRPGGGDRGDVPRLDVRAARGRDRERPGQRAARLPQRERPGGAAALHLLPGRPGGVLPGDRRPGGRPDHAGARARRGRAGGVRGHRSAAGAGVPVGAPGAL
ncbi:MAG: Uncharacterized conserved protein, contains double-stranded beta-helix domain, partial [uncultured Solirubrobacteraceae bacterium]